MHLTDRWVSFIMYLGHKNGQPITTSEIFRATKITYMLLLKIRNELHEAGILKVYLKDNKGRKKYIILTIKGEELFMKLSSVRDIMDTIHKTLPNLSIDQLGSENDYTTDQPINDPVVNKSGESDSL